MDLSQCRDLKDYHSLLNHLLCMEQVTYTKMCVCVDVMRQLVGVGSILPPVGVGDGIQVSGHGSMGSSLQGHLTVLVSFWLL